MRKALLYSAMLGTSMLSYQAHGVEIDGFLTAGLAVHDQSQTNGKTLTYLDEITENVTFLQDSKFGLQVSADVAENMQVVSQILASAADDNYTMDVEWAYLDYSPNNSMSLRAGRIKQPVFLISDYLEVGYAYPWIRPPAEAYSNMPVDSLIGVQLLYQTKIGGMNFGFQPYFGSNTEGVPGFASVNFYADNYIGMALRLENRNVTIQLSTFDTDVSTVDSGGSGLNSIGDALLSVASVSWDVSNFIGYAEYTTRDISADSASLSAAPTTAPNNYNDVPFDALFSDQDGYYMTLGYRIGKFLPHLTFANIDSDPLASATANQGARQQTITLGLRYELNDSSALKMEYAQVELETNAGNAGLFSGFDLVDTNPAVTPTIAANAFESDSTSVISIAVDVIF